MCILDKLDKLEIKRLTENHRIVWPWQKQSTISISPFDFEITLQAMTIEKLQFSLPAVFTIGPEDGPEALRKYSKILTGQNTGSKHPTPTGRSHVQDIVKGSFLNGDPNKG